MKRLFRLPLFASLPLTLAACGGGGAAAPATSSGPAQIHTLAYVVSECRQNGSDFFERYALVVRDGEHDPVTVAEIPELGPAQPFLGCKYWGNARAGLGYAIERGGFTRMGVSPDGSTVVFEETDELSTTFHNFLAPEQKGIFAVRADGTGLRRLGPPSREPPYPPFLAAVFFYAIAFSPDGRTIAFPDKGPGLTGEDAGQIFTMDLATGARTQVTHLPPILPTSGPGGLPGVFGPIFLDNETIAFFTSSSSSVGFTVKVDGSELKMTAPPVASGTQIVPQFAITGDRLIAFPAYVPGASSGPPVITFPSHTELFVLDGPNLLQLTNFGRFDTALTGTVVDPEAQQVFFLASADPLGMNRMPSSGT